MSDPKIVASAKEQSRRAAPQSVGSTEGWSVLGWIGLAFLVVGGMDFGLVWFPFRFGTPEWEFATVTQSFNGLPILVLGIGVLVVASEQLGRRWWGLAATGVSGLLLVWVLAAVALWALNVPLMLSAVPAEVVEEVQKAVAKTAVQSVVYLAVLVYLVRWGVRRGGSAH